MLLRLMVYNNVGLTSKAFEEIKTESTENCRFRQPHCRLTPRRYCRFSAEKSDPTPIPPQFLRCSLWTRLPMLWLRGVINFELVQFMCPRYFSVTDGQTDDLLAIPRFAQVHRAVKTDTRSGVFGVAMLLAAKERKVASP